MNLNLAARTLIYAFACAKLAACNPSSGGAIRSPGAPSAVDIMGPPPLHNSPSNLSLKEEIAKLEQSGQVVPLDRSDSLLSPDLNVNGVRDDIRAYINSLSLEPAKLRAALQNAKALQMTLAVDVTDKAAVQAVGDIQMASAKCFVRVFNGDPNESQISHALESKTANTKTRVMKYLAYNSASSGSVTSSPSGDTCEK
jgi:hypothetical protein